jgi:putative endonuclease
MNEDINKAPHIELGRRGEELALEFLKQQGYKIVLMNSIIRLGRNQTGYPLTGEIDIIAYENDLLCFIEVKTRRSDDFAPPEQAVDRRKQRRLARTARRYRRLFGISGEPYRFDVVAIVLAENSKPEIRLERNFFRDPLVKDRGGGWLARLLMATIDHYDSST